MASVALNTLRTSRQPIQRLAASLVGPSSIFSLSSSPLASASATSTELSTSSVSFSLPPSAPHAAPTSPLASLASLIPDSLSAGLRDLLPPWVFAVPKRRTTHSAKRMRSANKHLKEKQNLVACSSCGAPKLSHHLCHSCHVAFRREYHREAKEQGLAQKP
ncbi:hypothetical protein JCM5353_001117 [Sporobolomyces roseus]